MSFKVILDKIKRIVESSTDLRIAGLALPNRVRCPHQLHRTAHLDRQLPGWLSGTLWVTVTALACHPGRSPGKI
jgi:hypothetical protein